MQLSNKRRKRYLAQKIKDIAKRKGSNLPVDKYDDGSECEISENNDYWGLDQDLLPSETIFSNRNWSPHILAQANRPASCSHCSTVDSVGVRTESFLEKKNLVSQRELRIHQLDSQPTTSKDKASTCNTLAIQENQNSVHLQKIQTKVSPAVRISSLYSMHLVA